MKVIFRLDKAIFNSCWTCYEQKKGKKKLRFMLQRMRLYCKVIDLIKELIQVGVKVAIVTSNPTKFCEGIMNYFGISNDIVVDYYDNKIESHESHIYSLLNTLNKLDRLEKEPVIFVGEDEEDMIIAKEIKVIGILIYWRNRSIYRNWNIKIVPFLFCRDQESLIRFFYSLGLGFETKGLRRRGGRIFQLFDYYPISKVHDVLSLQIYKEVKDCNDNTYFCKKLCEALEKMNIEPYTCGIFVVPSSTARVWNNKLVNYVVPRLVDNLKLINCSHHILRHSNHDKQAFGGDRSMQSNLNTMCLQYALPPKMQRAIIIDDITTTGNVFNSCIFLLREKGIKRENIYCAAIGGTISRKMICESWSFALRND